MTIFPRQTFRSLAMVLLFASPLAWSQVYSWVDENGRKHFGDRIPQKYQDQAAEVEMGETNSSQAVVSRPRSSSQSGNRSRSTSGSGSPSPSEVDSSSGSADLDSCEAQQAAYSRAQSCWAQCRKGGKINAARSACRSCENIKKPRC
jgi:hypothetical protein